MPIPLTSFDDLLEGQAQSLECGMYSTTAGPLPL